MGKLFLSRLVILHCIQQEEREIKVQQKENFQPNHCKKSYYKTKDICSVRNSEKIN